MAMSSSSVAAAPGREDDVGPGQLALEPSGRLPTATMATAGMRGDAPARSPPGRRCSRRDDHVLAPVDDEDVAVLVGTATSPVCSQPSGSIASASPPRCRSTRASRSGRGPSARPARRAARGRPASSRSATRTSMPGRRHADRARTAARTARGWCPGPAISVIPHSSMSGAPERSSHASIVEIGDGLPADRAAGRARTGRAVARSRIGQHHRVHRGHALEHRRAVLADERAAPQPDRSAPSARRCRRP